jgi:ABC-2 type transport system permease protein
MILDVVRTGWLNLRRDRAALILSFIVPIVFFSIFAGIFGAQRSRTPKTAMVIADEDHSARSKQLIEALRAEPALRVIESAKDDPKKFDAKSAEAYVRAGNAPVALVIPKGFGAMQITFGQQGSTGPAFRIMTDSADPIAQQVVSGMLQKTLFTSMPEMMASSGVAEVEKWSGGLTPQQRSTINANLGRLREFQQRPQTRTASSGSVIKIETKDIVGESKKNVVAALYAAGIGVMFLLFTASNAGGALLEENENGTLDRILTTRLTMTKLLLGKMAYLWTLGVTQIIVMFVWGAIAFKLELFSHLPGFAIMAATTAVATSGFGMLLASLARSRQQLGAITTLLVLSISALGGSMFPRFLMPEGLQKAGLVLFNAWAIDGFTNVFWRDAPLSSLALPAVVLIGWGIVFFLVSRQLIRRWEVA